MKLLAADNEQPALNILARAIREAVPDAELRCFTMASEVVRELSEKGYCPDAAFVDIEMPGMTGLELAKLLKQICPGVNIVFVTGYSIYAAEAIAQRPSGYVMKPATREKVLEELKNLRNPPPRAQAPKRIRIQCFGSFEVFVDGHPLPFLRAKSKELLAYLVDRRGAGCTAAEMASVLWEDGLYDRSRQKQISVIRADLMKSLAKGGAEHLLVKMYDSMAVRTDAFDCDYYMALAGDMVAVNSFTGEYMAPYLWATYTAGSLMDRYGVF